MKDFTSALECNATYLASSTGMNMSLPPGIELLDELGCRLSAVGQHAEAAARGRILA
jgi:hypothetical protein